MKKTFIGLFTIALLLSACGNNRKSGNGTSTAEKQTSYSKIDSSIVTAAKTIESAKKPTVNVYIENSGSMDGYVKKGNEFTNVIPSYLTDIHLSFTNDINLYYINDRVIPLGNNINSFTKKLDPQSFRNEGGNRGKSDIYECLDAILQTTGGDSISIFVTDGIFSPGSGKDAAKYINDQFNGIKKSMADYLNKYPNTALIIYQLSCSFDGTFYDREDKRYPNTKEQLPYYIWIIGNVERMNEFIDKVPESKFKANGVQNSFSITVGPKAVDYAVKLGSGSFKLDKQEPKKTIKNLKKDNMGTRRLVRFSVNANLSGFLLNDNYLNDVSNYELTNNNYTFTISKAVANNFGYTHQLNFSSENVHKGEVSVKLKSQIPPEIEVINDSIGRAPIKDKTYGIKYQIQGIYEAFTNTTNYYTDISIKIN